jgi:C1A family cysteine protease
VLCMLRQLQVHTSAERGGRFQTEGRYCRTGSATRATSCVNPDYKEALENRAVSYSRLTHNLNLLKGYVASGYPFVFGFTVYESFESQAVADSGVVPMPSPTEETLGGHAVLAVGYDDSAQRFIIRNSWGTGWGMNGYFTMPYGYVTDANLADNLWTIRLITS